MWELLAHTCTSRVPCVARDSLAKGQRSFHTFCGHAAIAPRLRTQQREVEVTLRPARRASSILLGALCRAARRAGFVTLGVPQKLAGIRGTRQFQKGGHVRLHVGRKCSMATGDSGAQTGRAAMLVWSQMSKQREIAASWLAIGREVGRQDGRRQQQVLIVRAALEMLSDHRGIKAKRETEGDKASAGRRRARSPIQTGRSSARQGSAIPDAPAACQMRFLPRAAGCARAPTKWQRMHRRAAAPAQAQQRHMRRWGSEESFTVPGFGLGARKGQGAVRGITKAPTASTDKTVA